MKPVARIPRSVMQRKPAHGAPCNQCGACCFATTCDLGAFLFQTRQGPCPALQPDGENRYRCGIVAEVGVQELRDAALLLIRAGEGCDARFNGEPTDHAYHQRCAKEDADRMPQIKRARQLWTMT